MKDKSFRSVFMQVRGKLCSGKCDLTIVVESSINRILWLTDWPPLALQGRRLVQGHPSFAVPCDTLHTKASYSTESPQDVAPRRWRADYCDMKHTRFRTSPVPVLLACLLSAAIFMLDLQVPADIAIGVLYVVPVALVAMWSPPTHSSLVVIVAAGCTLLTLGRVLLFSSDTVSSWLTLFNHFLSVGGLWSMAFLSLIRKRMEQKTQWIDLLPRL